MRANCHITKADLRHGLLGRVEFLNLFAFGLLRLCVVADQNAITEPFLLGSFEGYEKY